MFLSKHPSKSNVADQIEMQVPPDTKLCSNNKVGESSTTDAKYTVDLFDTVQKYVQHEKN